jgi:hypothetical protein
MKYRRLIPLIIPLSAWLLSQIFLIFPKIFLIIISLEVLIIIWGIRKLAGVKSKGAWLAYSVAPIFFFLSVSSYTAIIVSRWETQVAFLLTAWFLFSYFKNLYYYFHDGAPEYTAKLDNILVSGSFLTVFASAAVLFHLPAFINWPVIAVVLVFLPIFFLLLLQFLPFKKIKFSSAAPIIAICAVMLAELAGALAMLPLNFKILALILAIVYYFFLSVLRLHWQEKLTRRFAKYPLGLSAIIILLLLLTAVWL